MSGQPSAAARRLRRHREEMELAVREGLPLAEARRRLAEAHCRRAARCGTRADSAEAEQPQLPLRPISWMDRYDNY